MDNKNIFSKLFKRDNGKVEAKSVNYISGKETVTEELIETYQQIILKN